MATTTITLVEAGRFGQGWAAVVERTRTGWLLVVDTGADHRRAVELGGAVDRCGRPVELDEIERRGYGALDRLADELEPSAARSPVQSGPAGPVDGACDDCGSPGRPVPGVYRENCWVVFLPLADGRCAAIASHAIGVAPSRAAWDSYDPSEYLCCDRHEF